MRYEAHQVEKAVLRRASTRRVPFRVKYGVLGMETLGDSTPWVLTRVALRGLIATQAFVYSRRNRSVAEEGNIGLAAKWPVIVRWRGRSYIQDGHHRLSRLRWKGRKTATVLLIPEG